MENKKPSCKLIGEDENIFSVLGRASKALKRAGLDEQVKKMREDVFASGSYNQALQIVMRYVDAK